MSSLRISGRSGDYTLIDGKFIQNKDTGLYLRHVRDLEVEEGGVFNSGDGDFMWQVKGGKVVSYHEVVCAGDVEGVTEEEDVPVNRAAALIEEALNAKASGCGCDCGCAPDCTGCDCDCGCPKAPVEEDEAPVEEDEAPVEEDEVPELAEAEST